MPFDGNKLYVSEILSILLQSNDGKLDLVVWTESACTYTLQEVMFVIYMIIYDFIRRCTAYTFYITYIKGIKQLNDKFQSLLEKHWPDKWQGRLGFL